MITITVSKVPGPVTTYTLNDGATVADALEQTSFGIDDYTVTVDGRSANASTRLSNGAQVRLSKRLEGNA